MVGKTWNELKSIKKTSQMERTDTDGLDIFLLDFTELDRIALSFLYLRSKLL